MKFIHTAFLIVFTISTNLFSQHAITIQDLWSMNRIGSADLSADGKTIVYSFTTYDMISNSGSTDLHLLDTETGQSTPFKTGNAAESGAVYSTDGSRVAYIKEGQIWICNADGSNDQQYTALSTGASGIVWSNDGTKMLFVSSVYPECATDECNNALIEQKKTSKVKAQIFTELLYRHWNHWREGKRSHLFLLDLQTKDVTDLTLYSDRDVPPISLGSGADYTFSPDDQEIAFVMNTDEFLPTSTNNDIFIIDVEDISSEEPTPYRLLYENSGNDNQPVYSPDGKYIAFRSMGRAGFEADKYRLVIYDRQTGEFNIMADPYDVSPGEIKWADNSMKIYYTAPYKIYNSVFEVTPATSETRIILEEHYNSNLMVASDFTIYLKQQRTTLPYELFKLNTETTEFKQLSAVNKEILDDIKMNPVETFWCEGAGGTEMQSIIVKPPFFDENKKYPMVFLIHGGPQGHWSDDFHYRWNIQMFAARGYVVVAPNPRGSVGYGQQFTDEISGDWGGKVYTDLMNSYDYAIENYDFIDEKNTFAAGASYGGYMINWIAGHTNRFNALVSHAGVFNLESMWGTTEELWFPEWELKGTPWENRELYEKWSPHRYIHKTETPVLVVHGAYDFRVPEEQAFQLFTSLQRLGVESKFLYFPDETHFVTKPQNAVLWWNTVYGWFEEHTVK